MLLAVVMTMGHRPTANPEALHDLWMMYQPPTHSVRSDIEAAGLSGAGKEPWLVRKTHWAADYLERPQTHRSGSAHDN